MTSFINPSYSTEHRGAQRLESAGDAIGTLGRQFKGAKGIVAMLLAGGISALVVVADQIVSTWTEGHLLLAWVGLWAMVFAALALFAEASRGWTGSVIERLQVWSAQARERADDERIWAAAQSDPRFMADIQAAQLRAECDAIAKNDPIPVWSFAEARTHQFPAHPWY